MQQLERNAKAQEIGGWGASKGRLSVRAAESSAGAEADAFDAFFHPKTPTPTPTPTAFPLPGTTTASAEGKLDVNTANSEALQTLPGVGPVLAGRIIAARPFQSADELRRVKGIGAKRYARLRPFFQ